MKKTPRLSHSAQLAVNDQDLDPSILAPGDRVRMSMLGVERHPKYQGREGTIVGMGSPNSFRVKFDDLVTIQGIYRDYLEKSPKGRRLGKAHTVKARQHHDA